MELAKGIPGGTPGGLASCATEGSKTSELACRYRIEGKNCQLSSRGARFRKRKGTIASPSGGTGDDQGTKTFAKAGN